jgi:hypothetical protein
MELLVDDRQNALSTVDVADYVSAIASELTMLCEGARLNGLATILYAAHLEARRVLERASAAPAAGRRSAG